MAAPTERDRAIGARIAQARREADGMTQRELADLLGVTERSVTAYERGEVVPYRFMTRLEDVLGKPMTWLLHGEQENDEGAGALAPVVRRLARIEEKLDELLARDEEQQ